MTEEALKEQETEKREPEKKVSEETQEELNWKKFREERENDRKKMEEEKKRAEQKQQEIDALKAALESIANKPAHEESDEDEEKKIQKQVETAINHYKQQQEEEARQREMKEYPNKLQSTFSDFSQVCTPENLDYMEYHYPEVASAFKYMPEGFDKWASVYKAVKRFIPNLDRKADKEIQKNLNKPQSMSASAPSQSEQGKSNKVLSEEARKANWERMQRIIRGG